MRKLLAIALGLGMANLASAQYTAIEDFDGGTFPPAGWTTTDNTTVGTMIWQAGTTATNSFSMAVGEWAEYDADNYLTVLGETDHDSELVSAPFALPAAMTLAFDFYFNDYVDGQAVDLDITTDGGTTWTNVQTWDVDTLNKHIELDLTAWGGNTVQLKFRYYGTAYGTSTLYIWYACVDTIYMAPTPLAPEDCGYGVGATVLFEDFESGTFPPAGWVVVDNLSGVSSSNWDTLANYSQTNLTPGSGEAACVDSDDAGSSLAQDTELWTPSFLVPAGASLIFANDWNTWSAGDEQGDVDISTDGGVTWTTLLSFISNVDVRGSTEIVDLSAYAGMNAIVRFYYYNGDYDYWWEVDNVAIGDYTAPPLASSTWRNDAGGLNPDTYTVSGPPVMGYLFDAEIDTAASSHGYAQLFAYNGTFSLALGGGQVVLIDITNPNGELLQLPFLAGTPVTYSLYVPNDCLFAGFALSTQAAVFNIPNNGWSLTNAQDWVVGF